MFVAVMIGILITMVLALVRAIKGPTAFDRILAVNMMGTKAVLFLSVIGFMTGRPEFLDLALIYVLINFVGILAVLKYIQYGDLGAEPEENKGAH